MNYDYSKRGYLLPEACKDLFDVSRYLVTESCNFLLDVSVSKAGQKKTHRPPASMPKFIGEVTIPEQTSVGRLATLLGQHPSRIIFDLLELGVYSCVTTQLEFRAIYKVARKYGYKAKYAP